MWGRLHFGVAIQNIAYDNQPGRSPGLLLINLSFHAVLIARNMGGGGKYFLWRHGGLRLILQQ